MNVEELKCLSGEKFREGREELFNDFILLAYKVGFRYGKEYLEADDIRQMAAEETLLAIDWALKAEGDFKMSTVVGGRTKFRIFNEIKALPIVHIGRGEGDQTEKVRKFIDSFRHENHRRPNREEISKALDITSTAVEYRLRAMSASRALSTDYEDEHTQALLNKVGEKDQRLEDVLLMRDLDLFMVTLSTDEQELFRLRYLDGKSLQEVGEKVGLTRQGAQYRVEKIRGRVERWLQDRGKL